MLSVIIPAYNEEDTILQCLMGLYEQTHDGPWEVIVVPNGCSDSTYERCAAMQSVFEQKFQYQVINQELGNKNAAMNVGDAAATYGARMYLDADVVLDKDLVEKVVEVIKTREEPLFIAGRLIPDHGGSFTSMGYAKIWVNSPYIRDSIPGFGCYTVNEAGRALWGDFNTKIYADDKYVRLLFKNDMRHEVDSTYLWPLPKGLRNLMKSRIRWSMGNRQLENHYPDIHENDSNRFDMQFLGLMLRNPISATSFAFVYIVCALIVRMKKIPDTDKKQWDRSR